MGWHAKVPGADLLCELRRRNHAIGFDAHLPYVICLTTSADRNALQLLCKYASEIDALTGNRTLYITFYSRIGGQQKRKRGAKYRPRLALCRNRKIDKTDKGDRSSVPSAAGNLRQRTPTVSALSKTQRRWLSETATRGIGQSERDRYSVLGPPISRGAAASSKNRNRNGVPSLS
jgi:hypothetical protein